MGWLLVVASIVGSGYAIWDHAQNGTKSKLASKPEPIQKAPAFTAAQLTSQPKNDWITNGGTLANDRYSPLDEIDTGNVGGLKGVWMTHLQKSATGAKYSAEAQPIVYKGTMYVATGADDVFAVDVATGKIMWRY